MNNPILIIDRLQLTDWLLTDCTYQEFQLQLKKNNTSTSCVTSSWYLDVDVRIRETHLSQSCFNRCITLHVTQPWAANQLQGVDLHTSSKVACSIKAKISPVPSLIATRIKIANVIHSEGWFVIRQRVHSRTGVNHSRFLSWGEPKPWEWSLPPKSAPGPN